jgi:hypothetical protein
MSAPRRLSLRSSRGLPLLSLAVCACACTSVPLDRVCSRDDVTWSNEINGPHRPKLDLLLVIDNTASMPAKQAALAGAFRQLLGSFTYEGFDFDYHIGVVSTDVGSWVADGQPWTVSLPGCDSFAGDDGRLQAVSCLDRQNVSREAAETCRQLCPDRRFLPQDGSPFLRRHNGVTNIPVALEPDPQTGRMVDRGPEYALACMALLGDGGCALASPLEAMKRALDGHSAANSGFLRDDAELQVLFLTDKDDCSVQADRRAENDPRTRDCTTPDLDAGYDCFSPSFRCLAHNLSCDQPLNTPGTKTGCFERRDTYLQPVADYVRFMTRLRRPYGLSTIGLWPLPFFDESGSWVVAQSPQVAGSAGLMADAGAQAACHAAGVPAWTGQPQRRLSLFTAGVSDHLSAGGEFSVCEPQSFAQNLGRAELRGAGDSVMSCIWDGVPKLRPDGQTDCVASDMSWSEGDSIEGPALATCSPACCAAMPSAKNLNWGWSWDDAASAACAGEPVDCFCVVPTTNCYFNSVLAAGTWRAGNADLPPETVVNVRCAMEGQLDPVCPLP